MPQYKAEDRTDRRERVLRIQEHVGGSHHRTMVADGRWYQSFSNQLLIIDPANGTTLGSVDVVPFGEGGFVSDIAVDGSTVWAVSNQTLVVPIDVSVPSRPTLGEAITAKQLGIEPRRVSLAGGEVWVSGEGGVVRLRDGKRFLTGEAVGTVVQTAAGPAASVRRRIVMIEDGRYLGAATELHALPPGFGPDGGYMFVLQGATSAQVGLMTPSFAETTSIAIPGQIRRARILGDKLFLLNETELEHWSLEAGKLVKPSIIKLKGARDVDLISPNIYAVAGTFGRAMYRLERQGNKEGDTFFNVQREPGLLEQAVATRTRIVAGGREGFWLWRLGREAELTDRTTDITSMMDRSVDAAWGSASVVIDKSIPGGQTGTSVAIKHDGVTSIYTPDGAPRISILSLVAGDLWIGHERGLDVLRRQIPGAPPGTAAPVGEIVGAEFRPLHQFRFEGPVLFIFPDPVNGGASVVSLHGGFLLIRPKPIGDAPVFEGRGTIK